MHATRPDMTPTPLVPSHENGEHVLMFTTEFPPSPVVGALRLGKLASYLCNVGVTPHVVTVADSAHTPVRSAVTNELLKPLSYALDPKVGVERVWGPNPIALGGRIRRGRRDGSGGAASPPTADPRLTWHARVATWLTTNLIPDEYVLWIPGAILRGLRLVKRHPVRAVWASFPWASAAVAAAVVGRYAGVQMVLDFRDSWASWPPALRGGRARRWVEHRLERWLLRRAAVVTAVNAEMLREIGERHPGITARLVEVPQGWDPRERTAVAGMSRLSATDGITRVLYAGSVDPGISNPRLVFDALASLLADGRIDARRLRFIFMGRQAVDVATEAREAGVTEMVEVRSHVERADALRTMAQSDALLLIGLRRSPDWITGKIWDYLTVARPIVVVGYENTAAAAIVRKTRTGIVIEPTDRASVAAGLASAFGSGTPLAYEPDQDALAAISMESLADRVARLLVENA